MRFSHYIDLIFLLMLVISDLGLVGLFMLFLVDPSATVIIYFLVDAAIFAVSWWWISWRIVPGRNGYE